MKVFRAFHRTHVETPGRADLFNESINAGYATMPRSFAALSTAYHCDKLDGRTPLISFTLRKIFPGCAFSLSRSSGLVLPSGGYLNPRDKHGNYTRGLRTELI